VILSIPSCQVVEADKRTTRMQERLVDAVAALLVGPSVLFTNAALTVASAFEKGLWIQLIAAFVGSLAGLAVGFVAAVYGLGVWS
jgi:hypothetical protein